MKRLLLLFLIIIAGCTTDENETTRQLPEATQSGANTFGTLINGIPFFPRSGTGLHGIPDYGVTFMGGYPETTDYYEIKIVDYKSEHSTSMLIHIQALDSLGVGSFVVNESNGMSNIDGYLHNYIHCRIWNAETQSYQMYTSSQESGVINITRYDFDNRIIAGTFSAQLKNSAGDIVEVTDGRFDLMWSTLPQTNFP